MQRLALAAALLASTAFSATAQSSFAVGVNYTNGNRFSAATMDTDIAAMRAAGVHLARVPVENYYSDNYAGTLRLVTKLAAIGISSHLVISCTNNPAFYPAGTTKREADPQRPSVYAAYRLSDFSPDLFEAAFEPILQQIEAARIALAGIELCNEMGNPGFNGDWPIVGSHGGKVLGYTELTNSADPEAVMVVRGLNNLIEGLRRIQQMRTRVVQNQYVPIMVGGLNTPGDCPAGCQLSVTEDEGELNALVDVMDDMGLANVADQLAVHSYLWGNQTKLSQLSAALVLTRCSTERPCAVTEWGYQASSGCPTNDAGMLTENQYYRRDFALSQYSGKIASIQYFDWKSPTYGAVRCGTLQPSGQVALAN
jgi:hypothetical protein